MNDFSGGAQLDSKLATPCQYEYDRLPPVAPGRNKFSSEARLSSHNTLIILNKIKPAIVKVSCNILGNELTAWNCQPLWKFTVFHVSNLLPYQRNETTTTPPPPDITNREPEQEIEEILDMRIWQGKSQ